MINITRRISNRQWYRFCSFLVISDQRIECQPVTCMYTIKASLSKVNNFYPIIAMKSYVAVICVTAQFVNIAYKKRAIQSTALRDSSSYGCFDANDIIN